MAGACKHARPDKPCVRQAIIFLQHTHTERNITHTYTNTHKYSYTHSYSYRYLNVSRYLLKRCKAKAKRIEGVKWA